MVIDKHQTNIEQKNDIIFLWVTISNSHYESNVYVRLIYNLYNGNVWNLDEDEYILEDCFSKPLACIEMSSFPENFKNFSCGTHEITAEKIEHVKDENLVMCDYDDYTYKQTSYYKIRSTNGIFGAYISIDYYFDPYEGWVQMTRDYFADNYTVLESYCLKPDEIFGDFIRYTRTLGRYQEYLQFYNYNSDDNTVDYCHTNESNEKIIGTAVFDVMSLTVKNDEYIFSYDVDYNVWEIGKDTFGLDMDFVKMK